MELHIYRSVEEVISHAAHHFATVANNAIEGQGYCNVVLSGGGSPKKLYELLAAEYKSKIDWANINFFFGDERFVAADDADYNGLMVKKALFEPLYLPPQQIFYIETEGTPEQAAAKYAWRINEHFKGKEIIFELILLGLGDNAHTASLFPHTPVLHEENATVSAVFLEDKNTHRITLTAPVINQAKDISFLVYGSSKAAAVQQVLEGPKNREEYPAQLIKASHWFMDEAAASKLKS